MRDRRADLDALEVGSSQKCPDSLQRQLIQPLQASRRRSLEVCLTSCRTPPLSSWRHPHTRAPCPAHTPLLVMEWRHHSSHERRGGMSPMPCPGEIKISSATRLAGQGSTGSSLSGALILFGSEYHFTASLLSVCMRSVLGLVPSCYCACVLVKALPRRDHLVPFPLPP